MWKKLEIDGLNKEYLINEQGEIFDIKENKNRNFSVNNKGYLKVSFYIKGLYKQKFVHRLVLMTFNPNSDMENLQVNHIDGDKKNNNLINLEWCTLQENMKHAWDNGLCENSAPKHDNAHHKKLNKEIVKKIRLELIDKSYRYLSKKYNVSVSTICQIANNITWINI